MSAQDLTHQFVRSEDGTLIYADAVGNPLLPSIVFVHGLSLSSIVFEGLFQDRTLLANAYLVCYLRSLYCGLGIDHRCRCAMICAAMAGAENRSNPKHKSRFATPRISWQS